MTTERKKTNAPKSRAPKTKSSPKESFDIRYARLATDAETPAASVITSYGSAAWGDELSMGLVIRQLRGKTIAVKNGDLSDLEATLTSQAIALNVMFAALARRAATNLDEYIGAAETYLRLALRAQNQCRSTLETLATIKNPPVVFAKQANIAHGHQQVNNATAPRTGKNQNPQTELLEHDHEQGLDTGTTAAASRSNPPLETVAAVHRSKKRARKGSG